MFHFILHSSSSHNTDHGPKAAQVAEFGGSRISLREYRGNDEVPPEHSERGESRCRSL